MISFIHSVQDGLPQVFIEPIDFTTEIIFKDVISQRCYTIGFRIKCREK